MLHHLSFAVADLERSGAFYDAALGALGYVRVWTTPGRGIGYGPEDTDKQEYPDDIFAIKVSSDAIPPGPGFHLAFAAPSRDAVVKFYEAAMRHGGRDNGTPGLCPEYWPDYYAAFVFDPDGYRIEAVIKGHGGSKLKD